jgi:hypothetical protein
MNKLKRLLFIVAITGTTTSAFAQFDESGIAAGFFDSSKDKDINFSEFHLPPLSVLFENAKSTPQIMTLEKARQIAQKVLNESIADGVWIVNKTHIDVIEK